MKGVIVCLDNVSFLLCPSFIIKEKEMTSGKAFIKISNSSKEQHTAQENEVFHKGFLQ